MSTKINNFDNLDSMFISLASNDQYHNTEKYYDLKIYPSKDAFKEILQIFIDKEDMHKVLRCIIDMNDASIDWNDFTDDVYSSLSLLNFCEMSDYDFLLLSGIFRRIFETKTNPGQPLNEQQSKNFCEKIFNTMIERGEPNYERITNRLEDYFYIACGLIDDPLLLLNTVIDIFSFSGAYCAVTETMVEIYDSFSIDTDYEFTEEDKNRISKHAIHYPDDRFVTVLEAVGALPDDFRKQVDDRYDVPEETMNENRDKILTMIKNDEPYDKIIRKYKRFRMKERPEICFNDIKSIVENEIISGNLDIIDIMTDTFKVSIDRSELHDAGKILETRLRNNEIEVVE